MVVILAKSQVLSGFSLVCNFNIFSAHKASAILRAENTRKNYFFSVNSSRNFLRISAASSRPPSPKASPIASEIAATKPIKIVLTRDTAIPS